MFKDSVDQQMARYHRFEQLLKVWNRAGSSMPLSQQGELWSLLKDFAQIGCADAPSATFMPAKKRKVA